MNAISTPHSFEHVILVRFRNRRWEVSVNGVTRRLVDWLFSRDRAVDHAVELVESLLVAPGRARVLLRVEGDGGYERAFVKEHPRSGARLVARSS